MLVLAALRQRAIKAGGDLHSKGLLFLYLTKSKPRIKAEDEFAAPCVYVPSLFALILYLNASKRGFVDQLGAPNRYL